MSLPLTAVILALAVRHIPQLAIDIRHRHRPRTSRRRTAARGIWIVALYLAICIPALGRLARSQHLVGPLDTSGAMLLAVGLFLGLAGLWAIRSYYAEDISLCPGFRLVKTGAYGVVRHPIRLGLALESLGLALISHFWVLVVPWLGIVGLQAVRSWQEDVFLSEQLGEEAVRYQATVPAWNPSVGIWRQVAGAVRRRRAHRGVVSLRPRV